MDYGGAMTIEDSTPSNRRSRKKSKTHDDLLRAGLELFASRGFDETTTNDIAEAADVAQRTLFRHFPTKESLLYGDMDETRRELRQALEERPGDEPVLVAIRAAFASLADNFERHRSGRLLQARLAATSPSVSAYSRATVQLSWEREIIEAVAARLGVDPLVDPRPEVLAGASMSAVRIATRQWVATNGTADFLDLVLAALEAITQLASLDLVTVADPVV